MQEGSANDWELSVNELVHQLSSNRAPQAWLPWAVALGLALALAACERPAEPPAKPKTGQAAPALPNSAPSRTTTTDQARGIDPAVGAPPATVAAGANAAANPGPVSGADRAFVAEAASAGLAEVEAGRYVADRATDPQIKSYAQQMERDHASANDDLQRLAGSKGIALPTAAQGDDKSRLDRLQSAPAAGLGGEFVQSFGIDSHNKAIELFERQARSGQDPDLRAFAERTLPRLREHLGRAQQLQGKRAGAG